MYMHAKRNPAAVVLLVLLTPWFGGSIGVSSPVLCSSLYEGDFPTRIRAVPLTTAPVFLCVVSGENLAHANCTVFPVVLL